MLLSRLSPLRVHLGPWLTVVVLVAFFLGPFYWPGSSAAWANFLRISVLLALMAMLWRGLPGYKPSAFQLCSLLFWGYLAGNAIFLGEEAQALRRLLFLLCFVGLVAMLDWRSRNWPIVLGFLALLGAGFALLSLLNLYRLDQLVLGYRSGKVFSSGIPGIADFGNTIVAAMHYAVCFCAAMWLFFSARHRAALWLWGCCALIIGCYVVLTYARSGWVACLVGAIVLLVTLFRRQCWRRSALFLVGLFSVLIVFVGSYFGYELSVRGVTYRDEIWSTVLSRVFDSWLWGYGAGAGLDPIVIQNGRQVVHNAHSLYLEVFYQFGLVGLLFWLTVLSWALWRLAHVSMEQRKEATVASFALALLAAGAVVMLVELNGFVSTPNLVWLWFWLPLGIALGSRGASGARY